MEHDSGAQGFIFFRNGIQGLAQVLFRYGTVHLQKHGAPEMEAVRIEDLLKQHLILLGADGKHLQDLLAPRFKVFPDRPVLLLRPELFINHLGRLCDPAQHIQLQHLCAADPDSLFPQERGILHCGQ